MKKILLFSNTAWSLYNFRKNLIKELIRKDFKVYILCCNDFTSSKLRRLGCKLIFINLERRGSNILNEIKTFISIYIKVKKVKPDIILNFTIKPIIYGSLVARFCKLKLINTLDGIGATFSLNFIKKLILDFLLKQSQKKVFRFFFVNKSDRNLFIKKNIVSKYNCKLINGTGIDLTNFNFKKNIFKKKIVFIFVGRTLYSKGIVNYLNSASYIIKKYPKRAKFYLAGIIDKSVDDNVSTKEIEFLAKKSKCRIFYNHKNIKNLLEFSNCVVLPTLYNEGLPRSLLEAAAMGKPIITTNIPGCKRISINNYNAFIFNKNLINGLRNCLEKFILIKNSKKELMSKNSRSLAENFDEKKVIKEYLELINE